MAPTIRRIVPEDWARARDLRLEALADPEARIAFLTTLDDARAEPDEFWRDRAARAASGGEVLQLLAEDGGALVGTVAVLVQGEGSADYFGAIVTERRAALIGVYVVPASRSAGLLAALVDEACAWTRSHGLATLYLDVHADNVRARRAYERLGFALAGHTFESASGHMLQMVRAL
ncbi:GNAT family N-acetyltransferase [Demequina mangrovi]|uniref:Protein N-acetyltransferase, RimJ/RimL family n=1 Tax=Demequina mangrovi TaxID=1043493 RepID=A0A1H7AH79_9MICO|nr:GNAT family N-acetyltransferase [Demequina mangrovi]SEJ64276.1 Protein N-acetyltransferase, RimJ/RimL family [Demequina mangrovi]